MRWFFKELAESAKRVSKSDPITFYCSLWGIITGSAAIFLQLWRLYQ